MRKFLLCLVLFFSLVFTSCENSSDRFENVVRTNSKTDLVVLRPYEDRPVIYEIEIVKFEYDEHKYLLFKSGSGNYSKMGVTHNPNCECFNVKEEIVKPIEESTEYTW